MNKKALYRFRQFLETHVDPYRVLWLILSMPLRCNGGLLYLALALLAEILFHCRAAQKRDCRPYLAMFFTLVLLSLTILAVSAGCEGASGDICTRPS